ncbi:MAG: hypothetical protein PF447_07240 [Spirochaetaceae bacterium]|nr:hypothetical protein [Spirochaetaceae bacterium]
MAQRFAWLNEWLRHKDIEMQHQELQYMDILYNGCIDSKSPLFPSP